MNLKCWADIDQVLQDTGAQRFNVGRSRDYQSNNNVFVYDKEKSFDENKQICERLLQRVAGETLYLTVWRGDNAKTSGCTYYIQYSNGQAPQMIQPASGIAGGLYGTGDKIAIDELKHDIEQQILNRFEKERLEREQKQLEADKRAFEADKNSALGLLVGYIAPLAKQLSGKLPRVAGLDANEPVHVAPIHAAHEEPAPGEQPDEQPETNADAPEESAFTDAEEETIYDLMCRFKAIEPDYLKLLTAVVEMAERGDATYTMAKGFLMK